MHERVRSQKVAVYCSSKCKWFNLKGSHDITVSKAPLANISRGTERNSLLKRTKPCTVVQLSTKKHNHGFTSLQPTQVISRNVWSFVIQTLRIRKVLLFMNCACATYKGQFRNLKVLMYNFVYKTSTYVIGKKANTASLIQSEDIPISRYYPN